MKLLSQKKLKCLYVLIHYFVLASYMLLEKYIFVTHTFIV